MITLLHGDYIERSREEFNRRKQSQLHKEIRVLDGKSVDEASLRQALESFSIFGGDTVVFIEQLFSKLGKKAKLIESLAKILRESSADVTLWEDKEVSPTVIKSLGKADIKIFKFPKFLFQFLDGIVPGNARKSLQLYHAMIQTEAPELVSFMLAGRLRQLIQLADGVSPAGLQGWQAVSLTRQAKSFTIDRLLSMYKNLLDMEYSFKSGSSPFALIQLTEQFIIKL